MAFTPAPADMHDTSPAGIREWARQVALVLNRALTGGQNNNGIVTLTANAASTTLTDARIGVSATVTFEATTANAAAERGNGTMYCSEAGRLNGSLVITHANNAQTDRTFRYAIHGG